MWQINLSLASMQIGEKISREDFKTFGDRIEFFGSDKIWIVSHVDFQCGTLSSKSPAHKPVFKLLQKYTLLDRVLSRLPSSLQEIEREKEIEREEEKKEKRRGEQIPKLELFESLFGDELYLSDLSRAHPKKNLEQAFEEMYIHHSQSPHILEEWQWRQKFNTWLTIKGDKNGTSKSKRESNADSLKAALANDIRAEFGGR